MLFFRAALLFIPYPLSLSSTLLSLSLRTFTKHLHLGSLQGTESPSFLYISLRISTMIPVNAESIGPFPEKTKVLHLFISVPRLHCQQTR